MLGIKVSSKKSSQGGFRVCEDFSYGGTHVFTIDHPEARGREILAVIVGRFTFKLRSNLWVLSSSENGAPKPELIPIDGCA